MRVCAGQDASCALVAEAIAPRSELSQSSRTFESGGEACRIDWAPAQRGRRHGGEGFAPDAAAALEIAADPDWFPEDFDPFNDTLSFVQAGGATLAGQPFLDHRWDRSALARRRVPREAVATRFAGPDTPQGDPLPAALIPAETGTA